MSDWRPRVSDFFNYEGSLSEFIRDQYFGAPVLRAFRGMWSEILAQRQFLHVSYEQLHANTEDTLAGVLNYCGLPWTLSTVSSAVEASRFGRMKALEDSGAFPEPWLKRRNGFPKVRIGAVGAYRALAAEDVGYLNEVFGLCFPASRAGAA